MIFNTKPTQKNAYQKLTDLSLIKDKSNELWSQLDETSEAAVSGGKSFSEEKGSLEFGTLVLGAKLVMAAIPSLVQPLFSETKQT